MDPSQVGKGPPNESFYHHSTSYRDVPPPPPPVAPPHMMYYPSGIGYPIPTRQPQPHYGFPPGYIAYPHDYPQPQRYNYQTTPTPYYSVPPTYECQYNETNAKSKRFVRSFIFCSCLLFAGFLVATVVMALMLHPILPVYVLHSLSVTNFNTTESLMGDWNATITLENPNERLKSCFSEFQVDFVRKSGVLAVSSAPIFEVDENNYKAIEVKASSKEILAERWELDEMENERKTGNFTLAIRVTSLVSFKSGSRATRNTMVVAICNGLHLVFQNHTGIGTLDNGGQSYICNLFM